MPILQRKEQDMEGSSQGSISVSALSLVLYHGQ